MTGVGGVGKTRLAVRLAWNLVDEFRDGVWLVDLGPLSEPDLVGPTIATKPVRDTKPKIAQC
jgi:predicted ATPase